MPAGLDTLVASDALVRAVLALAGIAVARLALDVVLRTASTLPRRLGAKAGAVAASVRPGLARRLVAAAVGLGAPVVTTLGDLPAAAAVLVIEHPTADVLSRPPLPGPGTRLGAAGEPRLTADEVVVVRPGDTLWDIARRHLPRPATSTDVAAAWPHWYAANRAAIGPDPALLRPGTRLRSPGSRPAGTPASSHDRPPATSTGLGAVAHSLDPDRR
jgi:nucleoid-associated protein YgaU